VADKKGGADLALIFGGGSDAAPEGGPSGDTDITELGGEDLGEEADGMPAEFAVHAAEAFPDLAGDDARTEALYRAIKACHPSV
jgi:hypothetical protein